MALESTPEVMNNLLQRIGAPEKYKVSAQDKCNYELYVRSTTCWALRRRT